MSENNQLKIPQDGLMTNDIELMKQMISAYSKDDTEGMILTLEQWVKNTKMSESEREEHFKFLSLLKESKSQQGVENYFLLFFTRKYFSMTVRSMNIFDQKMENQRASLETMEKNLIKLVGDLQEKLVLSAEGVLAQTRLLTDAEKSFINGLLEARKMLSPEHINGKLDNAIMQESLKGVAKEEKIEELEVKLNHVEKTLNNLNTNVNNLVQNLGNNSNGISAEEFKKLKDSIDNLSKKTISTTTNNTQNATKNTNQKKKRTFLERLIYLFTNE